jgi:hypothetical protein
MNARAPPVINETNSTFFTPEMRQLEYAVKNGISWFDIMYPRGSDALDRELRVGKYAHLSVTAVAPAKNLSGTKRRRGN